MEVDIDKFYQEEDTKYSIAYDALQSNGIGLQHLNLFKTIAGLNYALINPDFTNGEDQKTLQFIGVRLFNCGMSAMRQIITGYYQISMTLIRDMIEIQFLLDYFGRHPEKIEEWRNSTNNQRHRNFGPHKLYKILDEEDGFQEEQRKQSYQLFCEYAAHVSYPGFKLMANGQNDIEVGPFYDEHKSLNSLVELTRRYGFSMITLSYLVDHNRTLTIFQAQLDLIDRFSAVHNIQIRNKDKYDRLRKIVDELLYNQT